MAEDFNFLPRRCLNIFLEGLPTILLKFPPMMPMIASVAHFKVLAIPVEAASIWTKRSQLAFFTGLKPLNYGVSHVPRPSILGNYHRRCIIFIHHDSTSNNLRLSLLMFVLYVNQQLGTVTRLASWGTKSTGERYTSRCFQVGVYGIGCSWSPATRRRGRAVRGKQLGRGQKGNRGSKQTRGVSGEPWTSGRR